MKQTDDVPHRRGWVYGSWTREIGEFRVAIFHEASGAGAWVSAPTREGVHREAQRIIDELYEVRISSLADADPVEEAVTIVP